MSNNHIPENVANQIVHEYKLARIKELRGMIKQLDTHLGDADVVIGRRRALMDCITMLEERNWYRSYNIADVPPIRDDLTELEG